MTYDPSAPIEIIPGSRTADFPYGKRRDRYEYIIACVDVQHRERVILAFPVIGARYIIIGAHLAGVRIIKAVIMTQYGSFDSHARIMEWIRNDIRTRMLPDYQHEVHVI